MHRIFWGCISNSDAINEPFIYEQKITISISVSSQVRDALQSSSVTANGTLWPQNLERRAHENTFAISQHNLDELRPNIIQAQKRAALIQLLRSWREGDRSAQLN
jgi:hypothetical protein